MIKVRLKKISAADTLSYAIVVSSPRVSPTGNKFLEKIGFYKPLVDKWSNKYVFIDVDRLFFWLSRGARMNNSVFLLVKSLLIKNIPVKDKK